ncbi:MAG: hypothetical protein KME23_25260 [Goleter apudmare HA4340-LM2]|jgi:hypothetical protein|nr:hypothetical protein [Goleter apudmare HA4340-LM2]
MSRVQHDRIISVIDHQKLRRSRLSIDIREWDDEDTAGSFNQWSVISYQTYQGN